MQVQRSPYSLAHYRQADKDDRGDHSPDDFEAVVAMRIGGPLGVGISAKFPYDPAEADLRGGKRDAHDDDRDHELAVHARAVFRNGLGKPPLPADEHPHREDCDHPDCYSQKASHRIVSC
jgi:hypothetical protein